MKARIKATGEIGIVANIDLLFGNKGYRYQSDEVEIIDSYAEVDTDTDTDTDPDYWTRLEHTYAGMAMQGMIRRAYEAYCDDCANYENMIFEDAQALLKDHAEALADVCVEYAHALVKKMEEDK